MRFTDACPNEPFTRIAVEHGGSTTEWSLSFFSRPANADVDSVFELINKFLSHLPDEQQQSVYSIYEQARYILDHVIDPTMCHVKLTELCKELFDLVSYESVQSWSRNYGNISVPPTIVEMYSQLEISERNQAGVDYEQRTYLRKDYLDLVDLGILLKLMIPIWSEYITLLTQVKNNNNFKEYQAMSLLRTSKVINVNALDRLRCYVEASAPEIKNQLSSTLGGLGSSELPDWLMSLAILRKLIIVPLSSADDSGNLISVMYHHVRNTLKSIDRKFTGRIRDKPRPSDNDDADSKSVLETYKIKQEISDGDLMVLTTFTKNVHGFAKRMAPDINPKLVDQCMSKYKQIEKTTPSVGQFVLLKWLSSIVIPPRSIDNLNRISMTYCRIAAIAVLWHRGFYDLALIMSGSEMKTNDGFYFGGVESRSRIPKEYVDRFVQLFPHYQESGSKERDRQTNVACKSIDAVARDLSKCDWLTKAPKELQRNGSDVDSQGVMPPPSDLKHQLSELVTVLATTQDLKII